ncbi:MAG TPA: LemA family protein [Chitinophagaceae bacterium]|jgi:LemA protein|nr:LemA family protein [Chitinophagaceae bacterium]
MKGTRNIILISVGALFLILFMWGCNGCNKIKTADQNVKKVWSNVETNYQRRTDLYSSVIKTIEASANFEKSLLSEVVNARAKLGSTTVNVEDQASLDKFQQNQGQMQGAFSRLMGYVENYPDIKTTKSFQDFQTQIEGTENRINVARQDYNAAVEKFNNKIVKFPSSMLASMIGAKEKAYYKANAGSENPPPVDFNIK